ncbi:MAG: hypothetical protein ACJAT3_002666 [Akkermansiaceae bacterium]
MVGGAGPSAAAKEAPQRLVNRAMALNFNISDNTEFERRFYHPKGSRLASIWPGLIIFIIQNQVMIS